MIEEDDERRMKEIDLFAHSKHTQRSQTGGWLEGRRRGFAMLCNVR